MSDTSDTDVVPGPGPNCGAVNETDKIGLRVSQTPGFQDVRLI